MSHGEEGAATRSGFITLAGWTNVGKSTLLNRLIGEKIAAVSDVPQTTRNRITGVWTRPGHAQAVFVDTPGLHRPKHRMNVLMVDLARKSLTDVDVVLVVVDAARGLGDGDREVARIVRAGGGLAFGVLNKIDLVAPKSRLLPLMDTLVREWGLSEAIPVSAETGEGCDLLLARIVERLPEGPFHFADDYLTDQPERALVAEWIREKVLNHTREELPHASAVSIDRWEMRPDGLTSIEASIFVERESQKAIVIGRAGSLMKVIGSEARADIEGLLRGKVFLRLWVKVRPNWRDDERALREIGLA